jgi:large subunit ribosomal protein L31
VEADGVLDCFCCRGAMSDIAITVRSQGMPCRAPIPAATSQEEYMKANIHPTYGKTSIVCACGMTYPTRSTVPHLRVAVCATCHPWLTGRQKLVDTAGRVEKFQRKYTRNNAHN